MLSFNKCTADGFMYPGEGRSYQVLTPEEKTFSRWLWSERNIWGKCLVNEANCAFGTRPVIKGPFEAKIHTLEPIVV